MDIVVCYSGPVTVRTHCQQHVVNRASRFHRSAGIDEFEHVGRRSPVLSTSPSSSGNSLVTPVSLIYPSPPRKESILVGVGCILESGCLSFRPYSS